MHRSIALFVCLAAAGAVGGCGRTAPPPSARVAPTLTIKGVTVTIEIARTPAARAQGLMHRTGLPADHGMLFYYDEETILSFWMKNTTIPLSIAFIDSLGTIIDIQDMEPLDETSHRSTAPAQYALEMNRGWFAEHGIAVGDHIEDRVTHGE
ncbi:MAG: DUF192 domain-containing protein [Planctomycetota bacterium]